MQTCYRYCVLGEEEGLKSFTIHVMHRIKSKENFKGDGKEGRWSPPASTDGCSLLFRHSDLAWSA